MLTQRMKTLLGPFILRRLKADVASQLAPKDQQLEFLDMTPFQAKMYTEAVSHLRKHAAAAGVTEGAFTFSSCATCVSGGIPHGPILEGSRIFRRVADQLRPALVHRGLGHSLPLPKNTSV